MKRLVRVHAMLQESRKVTLPVPLGLTFDRRCVANPLSCDGCHLIGSVHIPAEYTETWHIGPDVFLT